MSNAAHDMFMIATRMAGFDAGELMREIVRRSPRARTINEPMVLNAMQAISDRYKAAERQAAKLAGGDKS
jgi:uncharacterized membrane protein YjdF